MSTRAMADENLRAGSIFVLTVPDSIDILSA